MTQSKCAKSSRVKDVPDRHDVAQYGISAPFYGLVANDGHCAFQQTNHRRQHGDKPGSVPANVQNSTSVCQRRAGTDVTISADTLYRCVVQTDYAYIRHSSKSPRVAKNDNDNDARAEAFDQFYTKAEVAAHLFGVLQRHLNLTECRMLEPSAGTGVFLLLLPAGRIGFDIDPKHPEIITADFLAQKRQKWFTEDEKVVAIGNPPFGKKAQMAIDFFNHAARWCEAIAFIVPASFQKASIENKLDQHFRLIHQEPITDNAFVFKGKCKPVPTVFQIWVRQDELRQLRQLEQTHPDFEFTNWKNADFAIRRNGANAGRVEDIPAVESKSCYYISGSVRSVMEQLDFSRFADLVAGAKSLAKGEIVYLYEERRVQN